MTAPSRPDRRRVLGALAGAPFLLAGGRAGAAAPPAQPRLGGGINLAGAEFNPGKTRLNFDYTYPDRGTVDYFLGRGFKLIRIPFLAERLVARGPKGLVPTPDLDLLAGIVAGIHRAGGRVILDMHQYGRSLDGRLIGRDEGAAELFAASWLAIATRFRSDDKVIFGLMNEPNVQSATEWLAGANAAVAAIRKVAPRHLLLVAGSYWSGAHSWTTTDNGTVMLDLVDPGRNFAYEVHCYLDSDNSGTHREVAKGSGASRLTAFIEWCRVHKARAVLGEFGWADSPDAHAEGTALLEALRNSPDVWLGWTYWAAGPWWGDYMFTVQPKDGRDRGQMKILERYLTV